jgi:hypothetical protein
MTDYWDATREKAPWDDLDNWHWDGEAMRWQRKAGPTWKWVFQYEDPAILWYVPLFGGLPSWIDKQSYKTYIVFPRDFGSMYADQMFRKLKA